MKLSSPIWLASRSPRRRSLLAEAGIEARIRPADIDDADLHPGQVSPEQWVTALAYLKARRVAEIASDGNTPHGSILAADTVCVVGERILGQPRDEEDARWMLRSMCNATHRTITGVCLLPTGSDEPQRERFTGVASWDCRPWRIMFVDRATVRIGEVRDEQIDSYIASGDWRGKAGGYNLSERIAAGWPIECIGDPATVMGLPMKRLAPWLQE